MTGVLRTHSIMSNVICKSVPTLPSIENPPMASDAHDAHKRNEISLSWFRLWPGTYAATSHDLNQWSLIVSSTLSGWSCLSLVCWHVSAFYVYFGGALYICACTTRRLIQRDVKIFCQTLTHRGLVVLMHVSKLDQHWFIPWLAPCLTPNHYLSRSAFIAMVPERISEVIQPIYSNLYVHKIFCKTISKMVVSLLRVQWALRLMWYLHTIQLNIDHVIYYSIKQRLNASSRWYEQTKRDNLSQLWGLCSWIGMNTYNENEIEGILRGWLNWEWGTVTVATELLFYLFFVIGLWSQLCVKAQRNIRIYTAAIIYTACEWRYEFHDASYAVLEPML